MSDADRNRAIVQFILIAAKRDAAYWTPRTIAREIHLHDLLDSPSEETLAAFRDGVLRGLVGKAAEKFWASDAVTASGAASIRSACRALNDLTIDEYTNETTGDSSPATR